MQHKYVGNKCAISEKSEETCSNFYTQQE